MADFKHGVKRKRTSFFHGRKPKKQKVTAGVQALRRVRRLERSREVKAFLIAPGGIAPTDTGIVNHLSAIPQGDTEITRDGLKTHCIGLSINYYVTYNQANIVGNSQNRTIIVIDQRQPDSVVPGWGTVMQATNVCSLKSYSNNKRFRVLHDKVVNLTATGSESQFFKLFIKLNMDMSFSGAAGTTMNKNGIYMLNITDQGANVNTLTFSSRVYFTDS